MGSRGSSGIRSRFSAPEGETIIQLLWLELLRPGFEWTPMDIIIPALDQGRAGILALVMVNPPPTESFSHHPPISRTPSSPAPNFLLTDEDYHQAEYPIRVSWIWMFCLPTARISVAAPKRFWSRPPSTTALPLNNWGGTESGRSFELKFT